MAARARIVCRAAVLAAMCACAHRGRPAEQPAPAAGADSTVVAESGATLEVENNSTLDVRVFVLRAGMQTRLGTVTGLSTAQFELKPNMIDREIRLYASPVGASIRTVTDMLIVRPGQLVSWKLDDKLRSYRIGIY